MNHVACAWPHSEPGGFWADDEDSDFLASEVQTSCADDGVVGVKTDFGFTGKTVLQGAFCDMIDSKHTSMAAGDGAPLSEGLRTFNVSSLTTDGGADSVGELSLSQVVVDERFVDTHLSVGDPRGAIGTTM